MTRPPRAWVVLSAAGVAWGFAHLALEAPLGAGGTNLWKLVLVSTAAWVVMVALAARGSRPAVYGSVLLGATVCFQLALVHFARVGSHTVWHGVLPWMTDPEDAPAALVPPYNLLMYAGIGLGLAIIWAGTRALVAGAGRPGLWLPLSVVAVVLAAGLADMTRPAAYAAGTALTWTAVAALVAGGVSLAAAIPLRRNPGSVPG